MEERERERERERSVSKLYGAYYFIGGLNQT